MKNLGGSSRGAVVSSPTNVRQSSAPKATPSPPAHAVVDSSAQISHASIIQSPIVPSNLTANQQIIWNFADVIGTPPTSIGQDYLDKANKIASLLGVPSPISDQEPFSVQRSVSIAPGVVLPSVNVLSPTFSLVSSTDSNNSVAVRNAALRARNNVFDFINRVSAYISQAFNQDLAPANNPFVVIANLQAAREEKQRQVGNSVGLDVNSSIADELVSDIRSYVDVLPTGFQEEANVENVTNVSAQISSFTLLMDGYGSGGNVATDMMRFVPSATEIKAQKNQDLLSAFDFRKRQPKIVFTADYQPSNELEGMVIGWKKIPDASGYILKRRGVFDNTESSVQVSNSDLQAAMTNLRDYLNAHILTFYDTIDSTQIWAYLDTSCSPDQYYLYSVQAYQTQNDSKDQLFQVTTIPTNLAAAGRLKVQSALSRLAQRYYGNNATSDDVNPWPIISLQIYGNSQFDWILAAINGRASINRNDSPNATRKFSYLGAKLSDLLSFMDQGLFVSPKDVNDVVSSVSDSVINFGVNQTVTEILHETGILYYFEGTPQPNPRGLNRAGKTNTSTSHLLGAILSTVDPETATLDLSTLSTNIPALLGNTGVGSRNKNQNVQAGLQEINVPTAHAPSDDSSQDDVQYLNQLPATQDGIVDLTTYDGLSDLTRAIRLFVDEGPNRAGGNRHVTASVSPSTTNVTGVSKSPLGTGESSPDSTGLTLGTKKLIRST